jgi:quercetin dioxygenase-like cupin family protein
MAAAPAFLWTIDALSSRLIRYGDLVPCFNAFIDCRTPGSEAKENFTIIGPGVSENPNQHVHIAEPHGYNIGGARQPPGCVNSQHSHDTAEVFVVHSGHWRFDLGEHGDDARIELHPGDVISIPTRIFRGFTALSLAEDDRPGFLWSVLGHDNPGRVTWAPEVFDMAKDYGLVLLENGSLVDTAAGEAVPPDADVMPSTTTDIIAQFHIPTAQEAEAFVRRSGGGNGPIIGSGGPLDWDHGFELSRFEIGSGQSFDASSSEFQRVLFVHRGTLSVSFEGGVLDMTAGDTLTVPARLKHRLFSTDGGIIYEVSR